MRRLTLLVELDHHIPLDEEKFAAEYGELKTIKGQEKRIIRDLTNGDISVNDLVTLVGLSEQEELRAHSAVEVYVEEHCEKHDIWSAEGDCYECRAEKRGGKKRDRAKT